MGQLEDEAWVAGRAMRETSGLSAVYDTLPKGEIERSGYALPPIEKRIKS